MTAWLGGEFTPADFDASLAPAAVKRAAESGQDALFPTGTPTRATKPAPTRTLLPGETALFEITNNEEGSQ